MILLFSVLTSIPWAVAQFTSLLVRSWSSPLLPPIRSMPAAIRKFYMDLLPMEMDVWWSWRVSYMIVSKNKLNRMGESNHPWRTPTGVLKNSFSWLLKRTAMLEFSFSAWMARTSPSSLLKPLASFLLATSEGRPGMSDVSPLSGISGLSFWFHFAISSLVLLPTPVTLSVLSFSACWPFLLNFFQKILQYFSLRDRLFCMAPV